MKKSIILLLAAAFVLTACGQKEEKVNMDELSSDNQYHYENKDLGFGIDLPADFIYYQTQRRQIGDSITVEFFVPTKDQNIPQEIPGYAKPITITLFTQEYWDGLEVDEDEKMFYTELARANDKIYAMRFWSRVPTDWNHIWNEDYAKNLELAFTLL